ncbi:HEPN domain-containing protein [Salinicola rhizosphaerae]|uniref:HEPN domain-containing protein n=1 Tax=Salinicola rhizosphaerae TaxID=1443141 RepID=A0ABQ3E9A0_9GAMM|nr:HEPN domain-containing protein [Salinicola rhizosphaerae]GHB30631.1 hypothetical protein GCM10009038_31780 [Salinicola rhizosphaerae]
MPDRLFDVANMLRTMNLNDRSELDQPVMRSVINRAYYAAFLVARDYCQESGIDCGHSTSHDRIVRALEAQRKWRKQGRQLGQIKQLRHESDYDWNQTITDSDMRKAVRTSNEILQAFGKR